MEVEKCTTVDYNNEPSEPGQKEMFAVTMTSELVHYFIVRSTYNGEFVRLLG